MDENTQKTKKDAGKAMFTKEHKDIVIDPTTQEDINKPLADPAGVKKEDEEFLAMVMDLIEKETINLLTPSTLINYEVYDQLSDEMKGKADMNAQVLLATLRDIKSLWDLNEKDTYQINNLVHKVRVTKERLENDIGDVYII